MKKHFAAIGVLALFAISTGVAEDGQATKATPQVQPAATAGEARARARLLHEMVHGSLQVMHRDFFDEDNPHSIPSASLEDVFHELYRGYGIEMKWLIVNTDLVNIDHKPQSSFERSAAKQLAIGKSFAERVDDDRYLFAGAIRLGSQCLKCHVKHRTSNEDRTAGVVISMPLVAQP